MRLLLIQPEYPPAVGGMQTHAAALARGLHERGHRVTVVTYAHPDDPDALAATIVRLCRSPELRVRLRREGLRRARQEFDWSVVVDAYQQIFERASARAAGPETSEASLVGRAPTP